jgi:hypothetical protein
MTEHEAAFVRLQLPNERIYIGKEVQGRDQDKFGLVGGKRERAHNQYTETRRECAFREMYQELYIHDQWRAMPGYDQLRKRFVTDEQGTEYEVYPNLFVFRWALD